MAYKLIKEEYCACVDAQRKEFLCDTDADFADLPQCCTGSVAVSAATGNVYVVNASGKWVAFGGVGEKYSTCEITFYDQDICGPYEVMYIAYENGNPVEKIDTVPSDGELTINAVQGRDIGITGSYSAVSWYDENGNYIEVDSSGDGTLYYKTPKMNKCTAYICG